MIHLVIIFSINRWHIWSIKCPKWAQMSRFVWLKVNNPNILYFLLKRHKNSRKQSHLRSWNERSFVPLSLKVIQINQVINEITFFCWLTVINWFIVASFWAVCVCVVFCITLKRCSGCVCLSVCSGGFNIYQAFSLSVGQNKL